MEQASSTHMYLYNHYLLRNAETKGLNHPYQRHLFRDAATCFATTLPFCNDLPCRPPGLTFGSKQAFATTMCSELFQWPFGMSQYGMKATHLRRIELRIFLSLMNMKFTRNAMRGGTLSLALRSFHQNLAPLVHNVKQI